MTVDPIIKRCPDSIKNWRIRAFIKNVDAVLDND